MRIFVFLLMCKYTNIVLINEKNIVLMYEILLQLVIITIFFIIVLK